MGAFRYVYDCGAMPTYREERSDAIGRFRAGMGSARRVDLIVLSHAHADHVNGVAELTKGLAVDAVMMPLLNVEERVIAYARSVAEAPASARDAFYRAFVVDPATALARLAPRRILFVGRGDPGGGAPGRDGAEAGPPDLDDVDAGGAPDGRGDGGRWKLVGRGRVERRPDVRNARRAGRPSGCSVSVVPDSAAVAVEAGGRVDHWLLSPYVDPGTGAGRREFFRTLADMLDLRLRDLRRHDRLIEILGDRTKAVTLGEAYKSVGRDINVSSLCLYSGPLRPLSGASRFASSGKEQPAWIFPDWKVGWLATGDATLRQDRRVEALVDHYGRHLEKVGTMTLPHHGSDASLCARLLDEVAPSLCVCSADRYSTWQHPGSEAIRLVASRGSALALVTASVGSELSEDVRA